MADKLISSLTAATDLADGDLLVIEQVAGNSRKITAANALKSAGLRYLASVTASGAAAINVTTRNQGGYSGAIFQSDFDDYQIEIIDTLPATNSVNLQLQVSIDGGSSYVAGTNYQYNGAVGGSGAGVENADNVASIPLNFIATTTIDNAANLPVRGTLHFRNPLGTTYYKSIQGMTEYYRSQPITYWPHGMYKSTSNAVNAFRVLASSGNVSGTIRVYGFSK